MKKKLKHERIIKEKCPICNHNKMFTSRGIMSDYFKKCSRCGYKLKK